LRAWSEYANWQQVHSDLTVAVYDAVYAAGMTFPFPQRDVHLISASAAGDRDSSVEPFSVSKKSDPRSTR
jgi:small-conductance mechanosensitive channel